VNVAAAIADLEAQRAKLDAAIAALRALQNGTSPAAAVGEAPPGRRRVPSAPQEVTPEQWAEALTWWNAGESAVEIAKRLGITDTSVFYHAQQHGWPKRRRAVQPVAAAAQPAARPVAVATVTKLEPKRRCPHCAGMTDTDPCAWCKKALAA
jgi:hypothetical protein